MRDTLQQEKLLNFKEKLMMGIDLSLPVAIGSDHAGFEYKTTLIRYLQERDLKVIDFGTYSPDAVDYADYAHPVSESVLKKETAFGVLLCGTANGVCITANKHAGIRAALCWNPQVARLVRQHNDANVLCIPSRFVSLEDSMQMLDAFIETSFEGGRHATRIGKMNCH